MTDTRMVALEQIAAGPLDGSRWKITLNPARECDWSEIKIFCRQIADAAGGDVYEPISGLEAELAQALRRANWKHPVQVEIING